MYRDPIQLISFSAALIVIGALLAIPSVASEFPMNLFLMALPFGLCLLIPKLQPPDVPPPAFYQMLFVVAGPWVGYGVCFHLYHGFFDGQGIVVAIIGTVVTTPVVLLLSRQRSQAGKNGGSLES